MRVMGGASQTNDGESLCPPEDGVAVDMATCPPSHPVSHPRPPAPVAPPPPPPPPMPPLLPVFGDLAEGLRRKRRVRSFFWKTIPEDQVKGRSNLWTQGREQQQHQIDVSTVEELFGQNDCQSKAKTTPTRTGANRRSFRETREEVFILDSKRGMNIGIFLKQFRRTNQMIINDICHGNSRPYGAEPLRELLKLLPESEEVRKLESYRGDVSKLSLADSFMYLLIQVPSYNLRVQALLLQEEFPVLSAAMRRDIITLRTAAKELMSCEELHQVLHLVLQAGNILNAGHHTGQAVGFKLSSLLSLADTKANKPGMSLLHFVALEAQKQDRRLLDFPLKLTQVASAARISIETLDAELKSLKSRVISLEESIQKEAELLQQLKGFLQDAISCLGALCGCWQQLQQEGGELVDFFCEDHQTFRLDDCFSIFNSFCSRFSAAIKENKEREVKEVKEAAHRRRIQELEEHKRHSWAGGEQVGGAFGLRCSSETDVSRPDRAALLVELLSAKPRPLGRSASLRRSRVSSSSSLSHTAGRQLSTLLGTADPERWDPPGRGPGTPPNAAQSRDISPPNQANVTSDTEQPCDHQASGELRTTSDLQGRSDSDAEEKGTKEEDEDLNEGGDPGRSEDAAAAARLSVAVEKLTLVPQLKVFDLHASGARGHHGDDLVIVDGEEDPEKVQSSSSQQEEEEKVMVWCVTGVCEAAGELSDSAHTGNDKNQLSSDHQEATAVSSVPANHSASPPQPANEEPSPVPISSQPAPVASHLSATRWSPAASAAPLSTGGQGEEPVGVSTNHRRETVGDQSTNDRGGTKTSCPVTNKKTGAAFAPLSKRSSKNLLPCKSAPDRTSKARPVRLLTQSEHQTMRRVLPIRTSPRLPSVDKHPEQNQQRSSGTEANLHRGQRPSTAPSSPRSGITRSSEDQQGSPHQKQDPKPRTPTGKAGVRPRVQPEEKICRSALRALRGGGGGGGGGGAGASSSAPTTPAHKAPPAAPLPSFAQSTASSSFRRSSPAPPSSSLKTTSSSVASFGSSSSLTRTGSLRVTKSSDLRPPACSAPRDPAAAPKGHRQAPGRSTKPVWR